MDEELKEKIKQFFKEHLEDIPDEFKEMIEDDNFYNVDNTWVLIIIALISANNQFIKGSE